jgi:malonate transporter MadL subunit
MSWLRFDLLTLLIARWSRAELHHSNETRRAMAIYGTALLSACLLVGLVAGQLLGMLVGVDKNVGGVGIAMLLLVVVCGWLQRKGHIKPPSEGGIVFWSSIYIPIVVAMAASQDVRSAVEGGPVAIVAGVLVVILGFAMVPMISRIGRNDSQQQPLSDPSSEDES